MKEALEVVIAYYDKQMAEKPNIGLANIINYLEQTKGEL